MSLKKMLILITLSLIMLIAIAYCDLLYKITTSETVLAKVVSIDNIQPNFMANQSQAIFSSAILLQKSNGDLISVTSEDRQWFVIKKDMCVRTKFFKYPFWNFDKSGTYYGARLLKVEPCTI